MITTEFLITSLVVVLLPGTGVIYTVSNGLFSGKRASIAAALGCTLGIVPHLTASILGLSAILHMSSLIFQTIKYAGALYLLYLAWAMWRDTGAVQFDSSRQNNGLGSIIGRGILINILNPKLSLFFFAFLPLFISTHSISPTIQMVLLSSVFMVMTFIVFILYGLFANAVRTYFIHSSKLTLWLQRFFATTFALLGIKLAVTEQ